LLRTFRVTRCDLATARLSVKYLSHAREAVLMPH
jgi:hypothetical protein